MSLSPEEAVNAACTYSEINSQLKQKLLEINSIYERGKLLLTILKSFNEKNIVT